MGFFSSNRYTAFYAASTKRWYSTIRQKSTCVEGCIKSCILNSPLQRFLCIPLPQLSARLKNRATSFLRREKALLDRIYNPDDALPHDALFFSNEPRELLNGNRHFYTQDTPPGNEENRMVCKCALVIFLFFLFFEHNNLNRSGFLTQHKITCALKISHESFKNFSHKK